MPGCAYPFGPPDGFASRSVSIMAARLRLRWRIGSTGFRPRRISKWSCGSPTLPVLPTRAMTWPRFTLAPRSTRISHAPGGLGVLELVFLTGLPEIDPAAVLAALLVFRLFYLLIPLAFSVVVILLFERSQLMRKTAAKAKLRHVQNR